MGAQPSKKSVVTDILPPTPEINQRRASSKHQMIAKRLSRDQITRRTHLDPCALQVESFESAIPQGNLVKAKREKRKVIAEKRQPHKDKDRKRLEKGYVKCEALIKLQVRKPWDQIDPHSQGITMTILSPRRLMGTSFAVGEEDNPRVTVRIGRGEWTEYDQDRQAVTIQSKHLSTNHCVLHIHRMRGRSAVFIEDHGSLTGTFQQSLVDGVILEHEVTQKPRSLAGSVLIRFGSGKSCVVLALTPGPTSWPDENSGAEAVDTFLAKRLSVTDGLVRNPNVDVSELLDKGWYYPRPWN